MTRTRGTVVVSTVAVVFVAAVAFCIMTLAVAGCTPAGKVDTAAVNGQLASERSLIASEVARQTQIYRDAQADGAQATREKAAQTLAALKAIDAKLSVAQETLAKALNPDGTINAGGAGEVAGAAGSMLPPPWNIVALLGLPLITGLIAKLQKDKAVGEARTASDDLASLLASVMASSPEHPEIATLGYKLGAGAKAALNTAVAEGAVSAKGA